MPFVNGEENLEPEQSLDEGVAGTEELSSTTAFDILVQGGLFFLIFYLVYTVYANEKDQKNMDVADNQSKVTKRWTWKDLIYALVNFCLSWSALPNVELDFKTHPVDWKVGQTISFRILFPVQNHIIPFLSYFQRKSSSYLRIKIVKLSSAPSVPPVKIKPVIESIPSSASSEIGDSVLVSFNVQESGPYYIHVRYGNKHLPGSPFSVAFDPAPLSQDVTTCLREAPIILSTSATVQAIFIRPMDKFGNECNYGDVDPSKFEFRLEEESTLDEKDWKMELKRKSVDHLIYNFTREIRKSLDEEQYTLKNRFEVKLEFELFQLGFFQAAVTYDGKVIKNGTFGILVFSELENAKLIKSVCTFGRDNEAGSRYQEGYIRSQAGEIFRRNRKVYVYIYPKIIYVKEFYLGFIPSRLATYRVLPVTKFQITAIYKNNVRHGSCLVSISDRSQGNSVVLEMEESAARLAMGLFAVYLKQRLGGSESFQNKQKFFYSELKSGKTSSLTRSSIFGIVIQRENLVNSSLAVTKSFSGEGWCRNFKVKFVNEEGIDVGGVRREWLNELCLKMFGSSQDGMFCSLGNSRLVHPNYSRDKERWTLKHYEFAGKVVGKCLFETAMGGEYKQMVNAKFSRSFLAQIIGYQPHYKYFEQDDPEFYLGKVKYILENDVSEMELTFSEEEYTPTGQLSKVVDLIPSGRRVGVNNENKEDYLNALAQYRLQTRVKKETEAFLKGLAEIVPDGLLSNFDENELEILLCGKSQFDLKDLRAHFVQSEDSSKYRKLLSWFWTAVGSLTDDERGRLLQFVTGSSILPHGGFKELQPPFRITVYDTIGNLPTSHTCFNEVCLSDHRSFEEFERTLKLAISEGNVGFGLG